MDVNIKQQRAVVVAQSVVQSVLTMPSSVLLHTPTIHLAASFHQAAQALSDMQTTELQARSFAAASSSTMAMPASSSNTNSNSLLTADMEGLSEADQLAILAALGHLQPEEQEQQKQTKARASSAQRQQQPAGSPVRGSPAAAAASSSGLARSPPNNAVAGPSHYYYSHPEPQQLRNQPYRPMQQPPPPPPRQAAVDDIMKAQAKCVSVCVMVVVDGGCQMLRLQEVELCLSRPGCLAKQDARHTQPHFLLLQEHHLVGPWDRAAG